MTNTKWYVLRIKPHKESALYKYATSEKLEVFYPTIPVNPVNPRSRKIRPYFPGYLFSHTNLKETGYTTFHWMPFSQGLVRVGSEPAPMPENVIQALQKKVEQIWGAGGIIFDELEKGDEVMISDGAFEGYRGIFDVRLPGSERVRVLLEMLNDRYVPLEINAAYIEKNER